MLIGSDDGRSIVKPGFVAAKDCAVVGPPRAGNVAAMTDVPTLDRRTAILAGTALLAGCGGRGAATPLLRAATYTKGEADVRLLFKAAGLAPRGFRVEFSEFTSGQLIVEAMNGGSIDFGGMSEIPPVFAAASAQQSFRQIAVARDDVNNQVVLVPKGSAIDSLAGLKGKRVGYVRATTAQYFLIRMLESVGLTWTDITPVALGVADGAAAFAAGSLDAWAIYGFPIQRAIATEGARILKTAFGFLSGNYIVAAQVDALADQSKSRAIGDYLRLHRRAYAWAAAHQDEWARIVAESVGVPLPFVRDQFRRRSATRALLPVTPAAIASQQAVADLFTAQKLIARRVDVTPLWDPRFTAILEEKA